MYMLHSTASMATSVVELRFIHRYLCRNYSASTTVVNARVTGFSIRS